MDSRTVALAQIQPIAGDLAGNGTKILDQVTRAAENHAKIVIFGELSFSGVALRSLLTEPEFLHNCVRSAEILAQHIFDAGFGNIPVIIGLPTPVEHLDRFTSTQKMFGPIAYNSAAVLFQGVLHSIIHKHRPSKNPALFEVPYFYPERDRTILELGSTRAQILFGTDINNVEAVQNTQDAFDTNLIIFLDSGVYEIGKKASLFEHLNQLTPLRSPIVYVNLAGAQDGIVFTGLSHIRNAKGQITQFGAQFEEDLVIGKLNTLQADSGVDPVQKITIPSDNQEIWDALVTGLREHCRVTGLDRVILGLSGGIDSALCAAIAADAVGAENVLAVLMPSSISSEHSIADAEDLVARTGIHHRTVPISHIVDSFQKDLPLTGTAQENLQARIRGMILMSISNQEGGLVLNTSNKSELIVGYSTIYGDSVGGYSPIKDVLKTQVWELARYRNAVAVERGETPPIPVNTITKAPSAELSPGQTDSQILPDYDVLDPLIQLLFEEKVGREEAIRQGFDAEVVDRILSLYRISEWKRQQSAIGTRLTKSYLGPENQSPIAKKLSTLN